MFIKFLNRDVCWLAGFWMFALKAYFISETENGSLFSARNCDLGGTILAPLGTILAHWGHLGGLESSRKDTWGSGSEFSRFRDDFAPILRASRAPRARNPVLFSGLFPCYF